MNSTKVLKTERVLAFTPEQIFKTIERGDVFAKWWGPKDFTNTFETYEFKNGGRWIFVMHAPNGQNYPNENHFKEIIHNQKVVIEHVLDPKFILSMTLIPEDKHTRLVWEQDFETVELANSLKPMCEPANEQNLDRLQAILEQYHSKS